MAASAMAGDAHFFEETTSPAKVRQFLDSSKESDKLRGMKWLLAMMSKGRDVSEFFPDVVKNVVVKSVEMKKMVYMYLVHYADFDLQCREIALLSINSFQKDLAAGNQLIRGLALRVMTSIRVPDIIQIQILAVRKCATDSSPYVRKCAANALPKIYSLDKTQLDSLKQILEKLLMDRSTMVLGSAVAAFNEICPHNYEILHKPYRILCQLLADMDEWTQISVINVLTRYVRNQFTDPAPGMRRDLKSRGANAAQGKQLVKRRVVRKAFYSDEEDESDEETVEVAVNPEAGSVFAGPEQDVEGDIDPDHRLALKSAIPLLKSRNSGVVLAVVSLHYYCGTQSVQTGQQLAKALVRILRNQREIQFVVLRSIASMVQERPYMFRAYLQDFFIKGTDPVFLRLLKLDILTALATKENVQTILRELQSYIRYGNTTFVCAVVRAVCRVAEAQPQVAHTCIEGLVHIALCTKIDELLGESLVAIRQLLQQSQHVLAKFKSQAPRDASAVKSTITPDMFIHVLRRLLRLVLRPESTEVPAARAQIAWLVGEYYEQLSDVAPDVLRVFAASFKEEDVGVKLQILNLAAKFALRLPEDDNIQNLMTYVLELARYDTDVDLRDRARYFTAMMGLAPQTSSDGTEDGGFVADEAALEQLHSHAEKICLPPKLPPMTLLGPVALEGLPNFSIGSLSSMVSHRADGYLPIPDWPETQPDPTVRDAYRGTAAVYYDDQGGRANESESASDKEDNLQTFYRAHGAADTSSSEEEDEDEEESSSGEESGSGGEESESEEGSDEEEEEESEESGSADESGSEESESESDVEDQAARTALFARQSQSNGRQAGAKASPAPATVKVVRGTIRRVKAQKNAQPAAGESLNIFGDTTDDFTQLAPSSSADDLAGLADLTITPQPRNAPAGNLLDTDLTSTPDLTAVSSSFRHPAQPAAQAPATDDEILSQIMQNFRPAGTPTAADAMAMRSTDTSPASVEGRESDLCSPARRLLRQEAAGGVQVEYSWRHTGVWNPTRPTQTTAVFFLTNKRDLPARRVRLMLPPDVATAAVGEIPSIAPGETVQIPVHFEFGGAPRSVRIELKNDRGVFSASFQPEAYELIQPATSMTRAEFDSHEARLSGFNLSTTTFQLSNVDEQIDELPTRIMETVHVARIHSRSEASSGARFAGCLRKGAVDEKVLIHVQVDEDTGSGTIQLRCDDPMMAASLIDVLKKAVTA